MEYNEDLTDYPDLSLSAGLGDEEEEVSFLTYYDNDTEPLPPLPKDPSEPQGSESRTNQSKETALTKSVAMKGISKVCLNRNELQNADKHLGRVLSLHLQSKGINALVPNVLDAFYSLAHLYLYRNKIEEINGLVGLPQLESLHLYENRIRRIQNLEHCLSLRRLYLGQNEIEVVEGLENLSMLLELHVEDQRLPPEQPLLFCPNSMDTISGKLKVLNISGNQIESIEDLICMDVLDTLYASRNNLSDLNQVTMTLQTLGYLRVVDLRNNGITKNPRYKEQIVGHLKYIEVLDTKEINETTKCFLQRFSSVKAHRMRRQVPKQPLAAQPNSRSNINPSTSSFNIPSTTNFPTRFPPSQTNMAHFQFSTPISASPTQDQQYQEFMYPPQMPQKIQGQGVRPQNIPSKGPSRIEIEKVYAARYSNQLDEESKDPEKMSEMAKIIFRLSNLSPSGDEQGSKHDHFTRPGEDSYWNSDAGQAGTVKEARPLSPLETVGSSISNRSLKPSLGTRKSAPIRRPMARKLPPRNTVGAGRTLSPLQELPTPDSMTRESHMGDWLGQSLKMATVAIPPWLNKSRKDVPAVPSKTASMP